MQFRVLGPLEVADGERVVTPSSARRRRLLAALLAHAGRVVSLERLVDGVWGDDPPPSAHLSLRSHVSRLRTTLAELEAEPERLITRGGGYALAREWIEPRLSPRPSAVTRRRQRRHNPDTHEPQTGPGTVTTPRRTDGERRHHDPERSW